MKIRIPTLNTAVWVAAAVVLVVIGIIVRWTFGGARVVVTNHPHDVDTTQRSSLNGLPCENATRRPIAVMVSSDTEARPLSGIGEADMVFEMPVTPNGITRLMAVFQCNEPKQIGSVRSAREDFIPLAQGLDAVLAHWGGEHDALAHLNAHIIDNVDAMKYEGSTFYRAAAIAAPHNGFTTLALVRDRADELGYRASTSLPGHLTAAGEPERNLGGVADTASVSWPVGMGVTFTYDAATDTYLRSRGGKPEIDKTTGEQVHASVVIVMQTDASFLRDQYIRVRTTGTGTATIWQGDRRISALWKKPSATDMLTFTDGQNRPIALNPGVEWILIDAPLPAVTK